MPDETQQPDLEPSKSEPVSQPTAPSEPTEPAPISPTEPIPTEVPPEPAESFPSPEDITLVNNNDISANEPLESTSEPPNILNQPSPEAPAVTVEKHGTDTTITEVMQPTAQMAGNEPLDIVEEEKIKKRKENLKLANQTRQNKKREKIDAILDLFAKQTNLTNDEVEKLLHVSDATATRYLKQLEKEGKVKQVGKTGKGVSYIIKI